MYKLIETYKDFYVLSSIQDHIDLIQKKKDSKNKVTKKLQEIYDRGCIYKNHTMKYPVIKPYDKVFKIKEGVNVKSILNLFYTDKELRKRSLLQRPKVIEKKKANLQYGGDGFKHIGNRYDVRRYILTDHHESYVLKISKLKEYSCAYEDESRIYETLGKKNDIIRYYESGIVKVDGDNIQLIDSKTSETKLSFKNYLGLKNIDGSYYNRLENTKGYVDLYEYVENLSYDDKHSDDNDFELILVAFNEIMKTIKKYNEKCGFFHGDLKGDNVKVKVTQGNVDVKLFDFDFSGIIDKNVLSRNITIYNLKFNGENVFSCKSSSESENTDICKCVVTVLKNNDVKRFMYIFDYFRLLIETIFHLENVYVERYSSKNLIRKIKLVSPRLDIVDKEVFENILDWYIKNISESTKNSRNMLWKHCFKNSFFCKQIYNDRSRGDNGSNGKLVNDDGDQNILNNIIKSMTLSEKLKHLKNNKTSSDLSSNFSTQ